MSAPIQPSDGRVDPAADSPLAPMAIWVAVRKHWLWVAILAAVGVLGATFFSLGQKKIYQARATVMFEPNPPRPLGAEVQTVVEMSGWEKQDYYKTQYWVISSMPVVAAVVRELGLNKDTAFLENASPGKKPPPHEVSVEVAATKLKNRLEVEGVKGSRLAEVTYRDANPERAQRITNAIIDTYVQQNLDGVLESTISAGDWLRSQLHKLKDDLESSEMALHDYKQHKHILSVSLDDQSNMLREEMQQLNSALTSVRTQLQKAVAKRDELNKIDTADPSHLPALDLLDNPTLQQLRNAYAESNRRRESLLSAGKGLQHPEVAAEHAKVETLRTAILNEVNNIKEATDREVDVLRHEEGGLAGLYANAEQRARDLNLLEIEYTRLMRAKDNNEKLFSLVLERTKESDLARMLRVNNIRVADRPILPKVPVSPHVPMNIAVGALLGLLLGLSTAIGREHLDRSIKSPEDIEKDLGLTFLGMLPELDEHGGSGSGYRSRYGRRKAERERSKEVRDGEGPPLTNKPELAVHEHSTSAMAEAARAIRTNILFMAPDEPYRTLLVTSASPREGKTTVACCVAVAMAQAGQRVALLDCDMRRPRLHRVFSTLVNEGLTNALIDPSRADKMAQQTSVPNLWVVPTGPLPPNPAEVLHSEAFEKLFNTLRESFDRVIVDSPPVAPVTDAAILSTKVDGTLLVVRALKTKKDPARRSVRALTDVGGRLVGVVLNAVSGSGNPDYYHYY